MNWSFDNAKKLADEITEAAKAAEYWQEKTVAAELRLVLSFFQKTGFVFGEQESMRRAILAREIQFDWMFKTALDVPRIICCGSSFVQDEYKPFLERVLYNFPANPR